MPIPADLRRSLPIVMQPLDLYLDSAHELVELAALIERSELKADSVEVRFAREAARLFPVMAKEHHLPVAELVHRMVHERMEALEDAEKLGEGGPEAYVSAWTDKLRSGIVEITGVEQDYWLYNEVWARVSAGRWGSEVLQSSLLLTAIADFEVFISRLVQAMLQLRPEILRSSDHRYSYKDLEGFTSIEEARQHCAQEVVDGLLRGGFEDWTAWLLKQGIQVEGVTDKPGVRIIEAFQRRHLLVHNGGRVNEFYLAKAKGAKALHGDRLGVSERYLRGVVAVLSGAALSLAFALILKLHKANDAREYVGRYMDRYCFRLLCDGQDAAVVRFAKWAGPHAQGDTAKLHVRVDYWVARKRLEGVESIAEEVRAWDTSALSGRYSLVQLALLDDRENGYALAKRLVANGDLHVAEWNTWPALEGLRLHEASLGLEVERIDPSGFSTDHGETAQPADLLAELKLAAPDDPAVNAVEANLVGDLADAPGTEPDARVG